MSLFLFFLFGFCRFSARHSPVQVLQTLCIGAGCVGFQQARYPSVCVR
ncbi:hypothetical protein [Hoylesella loescheii]|nr:hypothetical protein [Hoylesella loescheii]